MDRTLLDRAPQVYTSLICKTKEMTREAMYCANFFLAARQLIQAGVGMPMWTAFEEVCRVFSEVF